MLNHLIDQNCIIVCPNEKKEELIKLFSSSLDYSIKYLSKNELISSLTFSYDDEAILYLLNKGYSFDNALEILNNLNFIKKGNDKLDLLFSIKEELISNNLLKYRPLLKKQIENKKVYIYGYSKEDREITSLLNNYEFIDEDEKRYEHQVFEFENIEDEVTYMFNQICRLVNNKEVESLLDIGILNYPSEYEIILRKYSKFYNMPINFSLDMKLSESPLFNEYISLVKEKQSFEDAFESIKEKEDKLNVLPKIINLSNDILDLNYNIDLKISLIKNKARNIKLSNKKYKYGIDIVSSSYRGNKHIFVLGFSLGSYPIIKKDTDFLLDKEKEICGLNTSKIENSMSYEKLEKFLFNNKNLHISLKNKIGKKVYFDSLLINRLGYKKVKPILDNERYSLPLSQLEVASYQDLLFNYGIDNKYLYGIDPHSFSYKKYNHKFYPSPLFEFDKEMKISYSQINEYNKCPFSYFIKRICKVDDFEMTFEMKLGELFHKVLEDSLKKEVKKEDYEQEINEKFITDKEKFFVEKLFSQILEVINKNENFKIISSFKNSYGEQNMSYYYDENTILRGIIDKLIINEDDKEVIIVDYKTGGESFNKAYIPHGLSLQLLVYSLLVKKNYPEYSQAGIYIQNVLSNEDNIDKMYKLSGITINENEKLEHLEHALSNYSKYVQGLRKTKNGYQETSRLISNDEFESLVKEADSVIKETISKIRKGVFDISPIYINGVNKACDNCPLKAVCFKDDDDNRYIKIDKEDLDEEE